MQILINTDGHKGGGEALASSVNGMIETALARFSAHVTRVEVHLSDENGSKGGDQDKRCVIEARMEGRKPVAVSDHAASMKQALQGAIDKLQHLLDRTVGKLNDHRRNMPEMPEPDSYPT
jgi:ribosome-associated translation inhibitor RaiA